jgi:hypothetical protein
MWSRYGAQEPSLRRFRGASRILSLQGQGTRPQSMSGLAVDRQGGRRDPNRPLRCGGLAEGHSSMQEPENLTSKELGLDSQRWRTLKGLQAWAF